MSITKEIEFKDYIIPKPWGREYLAFETSEIGAWLLEVEPGQQTSLHCHPNKKTGLIVLEGTIEISFLSSTHRLPRYSKTVIREGVFHSSKVISKSTATILEVETPKNKLDLVRLEDGYGRQGKEYEPKQTYENKTNKELWIPNEDCGIHFKDYRFCVCSIDDLPDPLNLPMMIIALSDHVVHYNHHPIVKCGDVITHDVFNRLTQKFNRTPNSRILTIESFS